MKLFAGKFYDLHVITNVCLCVRLINKVSICDQRRQVKSISESWNIKKAKDRQQVSGQRRAQQSQHHQPAPVVANLKICEKLCHVLLNVNLVRLVPC